MPSIGQKVMIVARVAKQQAGRNRKMSAIMKAVGATARTLGHVLHLLWLEVTGTVFLAMAAIGGIKLVHEYAKYEAGKVTAGRLAIATLFTVTFAWFGVSSFWRVRRKGKGGAQ